MKRFHVHVADLESSVGFYSTLFGQAPSVVKSDYAKWMLEDPRLNFAMTSGATAPAIGHLGFPVESDDELRVIEQRLDAAGQSVMKQENAACCYARGNRGWV
jgi:catechol 2,3-dioxygenase-like lactoylglutathione lyase family enzyme